MKRSKATKRQKQSKATKRQKQPSSPAETVASNDDLLNQILVRLPEKSLIRFKLVSKPWRKQISSPKFAHDHALTKNSPIVSGILLYTNPDPKASMFDKDNPECPLLHLQSLNPSARPSFEKPAEIYDLFNGIPKGTTGLKILSYCNGLILCTCNCFMGTGYGDVCFLVYNPTTKDSMYIPVPCLFGTGKTIVGASLVYDPWQVSPYFRIVLALKHRAIEAPLEDYIAVGFKIYYPEWDRWYNTSWRDVPRSVFFKHGVYWEGKIHYINEEFGKESYHFTVKDKCLKALPELPLLPDGTGRDLYKPERRFSQSGGHLYLLDWRRSQKPSFYIYDMVEDYSKWTLLYQIPTEEIQSALSEAGHDNVTHVASSAAPLGVISTSNGDLAEIVCRVSIGVVSYDPKSRAAKMLLPMKENCAQRLYGWRNFAHFSETLAPVRVKQK